MTDGPHSPIDDALAQAAAGWIARLQSADATDQDRLAFEHWQSGNPSRAAAYAEMSALWADLRHVPIAAVRVAKAGRRPRAAIANVLVLCFVALLPVMLYRMGLIDRWRSDYYTGVGEVRTVTLDDGTRIDLNTDTAIAVRYSPTGRHVELLRGEAFFDVAKHPDRPFVVEDSRLSATALGTRYGVATAGRVQVEEGRVAVQVNGTSTILEAGDAITVDEAGQLAVGTADIANETAWREGQLVFSDQPLREVLATLARYRLGRIVILDDAAAGRNVSGVFDLADTDQALRLIEERLPITVTRLGGMLVLVGSR